MHDVKDSRNSGVSDAAGLAYTLRDVGASTSSLAVLFGQTAALTEDWPGPGPKNPQNTGALRSPSLSARAGVP